MIAVVQVIIPGRSIPVIISSLRASGVLQPADSAFMEQMHEHVIAHLRYTVKRAKGKVTAVKPTWNAERDLDRLVLLCKIG